MRLVLDASFLVPLLTDEERSHVMAPIVAETEELHVPAVCDSEVVSGLVRHVRLGAGSRDAAREALIDYISLPLTRHLHVALIARTYELAENFAASDASYVALAEALDAGLVTLDGPLARAVRRHTSVKVLP